MKRFVIFITMFALLLGIGVFQALALDVDKYIKELKQSDPKVRAKAAYELGCGWSRPKKAVAPLIEALKDPEWKVRAAAVESLGGYRRYKKQIVPKVLSALHDNTVETRRAAILALGELKVDSKKVDKDFIVLSKDPDPIIRLNVKIAQALLGEVDPASISDLLKGLRTKHKKTSRLAKNALQSIAKKSPDKMLPELIETLKTGDGFVLINTLGLLRTMKTAAEPAIPYMIPLYDKDDPILREDTLATLAYVDKSGDQAIPVLVKALKDPDQFVRREALYGLLIFRDKADQHITEIAKLLDDKSDGNIIKTLDFISSLGSKAKDATPKVLKLTNHKNKRVRLKAVQALGNIGSPSDEVIKALQGAIRDENTGIRRQAIISLQRLEDAAPNKVLPILVKELNNSSNKVTVLESIAGLGPKGKDAVPVVLKITSDDNDEARLNAVKALGRIASPTDDVVNVLQQALSDKSLGVRKQAVVALEHLGETDEGKVVPILIEALRHEKDRIVKDQLSRSLKHLARDRPAPRSDASTEKGIAVR